MPAPDSTERPLDLLERIWWQAGQLRAPAPNGLVIVQVEGRLAATHLRSALDLLQQRNPLLGVRIPESIPPAFARGDVPPIPLATVPRATPLTWCDVAEAEMNEPLPLAQGPLARAVHVDGGTTSDIVFTFHHAIGDAITGVTTVKELLILADALARGERTDHSPLKVRASVETLLPSDCRGLSGWLATAKVASRLVGSFVRGRPRPLARDGDKPPKDRTARLHHRELSREETSAFAARCKEQDVTKHSAVCAAVMGPISRRLAGTTGKNGIACISPVDLRGLLEGDVSEHLGTCISIILTIHRFRDYDLWELARDVRQQMRVALKRGDALPMARIQGLYPPSTPPERLAAQIDRSPLALVVSGLMRPPMPTRIGGLKITGLQLAQSIVTPNVQVTASFFDGRLNLNFEHAEPMLSAERVAAIANETIEILRSGLQVGAHESGAPQRTARPAGIS